MRVAAAVAALAGGAVIVAFLWALLGPLPADPAARLPAGPTVYLDRNGQLLYRSPADDRALALRVGLSAIPSSLRLATIATEDARFYARPIGLDPLALLRAGWQSLRSGRLTGGGSTIEEQLARQLYFAPAARRSRSPLRKLQEWVWALRLGRHYGHDRLLELYLNAVDYGNGAVGAEAAAQVYFGKPARDLDLAQAALLAGLVQAPSRYDPLRYPMAALARRREALGLMARRGYITPAQQAAAAAEPLALAPIQRPLLAPHFVALVRQQAQQALGAERVAAGGLVVRTTLDLGLQRAAEAAVAHRLELLKAHDVSDAAVVALDPQSGEILALVGGADYFDPARGGNVNAALALRQPGSAIKPVIYAAALIGGMTAASELDDVHQNFPAGEYGSFAPDDYDTTFHGPVPLRVALASSLNVPAVETLQRVGRDAALQVAARLGLGGLADSSARLSLALGGGETRLLDLTAAYAAFANGGLWQPSRTVTRVEDARGRTVLRPPRAQPQQAVSAQVAYLLTDILSDDDARALGFGYHSVLELNRPAAVKTGTTADFHDNWTVGYTPDLVVGVWTGNADGHPMRDVSGVSGAAPIWREVMERALAGKPVRPFVRPEGIISAVVCSPTGLLPGPDCPRPTAERFVEGTEPHEREQYYRALAVCAETGQLADAGCAGPIVSRVFPFPPPTLVPWMREAGVELPPIPPYFGLPGIGAPPTGTPGSSRTGAGAALVITSPDAGAVYHVTPAIPADEQRLPLGAVAALAGVTRVGFTIDGIPAGESTAPPYQVAWRLSAGDHLLRATAFDVAGAEVASASIRFAVLGP